MFGYVAAKVNVMNQSDQQSEWDNESLKLKVNMDALTILTSIKVKVGDSEVEGVNDAYRLTNEVMNEWINTKM